MTNRMPELLCPAGNLESLEAALHFGADAVYGGMKQFGLRAFAGNFDEEALTQAVEKMHGAGKKFYLTMNIFPFDDQLDDFIAAAKAARDIGVDAAIVSDLGGGNPPGRVRRRSPWRKNWTGCFPWCGNSAHARTP